MMKTLISYLLVLIITLQMISPVVQAATEGVGFSMTAESAALCHDSESAFDVDVCPCCLDESLCDCMHSCASLWGMISDFDVSSAPHGPQWLPNYRAVTMPGVFSPPQHPPRP